MIFIVPTTVNWLDASASPYNQVKGGDTLQFQGGVRDYIGLKGFKGDPTNPIIVTNLNSDVVVKLKKPIGRETRGRLRKKEKELLRIQVQGLM